MVFGKPRNKGRVGAVGGRGEVKGWRWKSERKAMAVSSGLRTLHFPSCHTSFAPLSAFRDGGGGRIEIIGMGRSKMGRGKGEEGRGM